MAVMELIRNVLLFCVTAMAAVIGDPCGNYTQNQVPFINNCQTFVLCWMYQPYWQGCPFGFHLDPATNNCIPGGPTPCNTLYRSPLPPIKEKITTDTTKIPEKATTKRNLPPISTVHATQDASKVIDIKTTKASTLISTTGLPGITSTIANSATNSPIITESTTETTRDSTKVDYATVSTTIVDTPTNSLSTIESFPDLTSTILTTVDANIRDLTKTTSITSESTEKITTVSTTVDFTTYGTTAVKPKIMSPTTIESSTDLITSELPTVSSPIIESTTIKSKRVEPTTKSSSKIEPSTEVSITDLATEGSTIMVLTTVESTKSELLTVSPLTKESITETETTKVGKVDSTTDTVKIITKPLTIVELPTDLITNGFTTESTKIVSITSEPMTITVATESTIGTVTTGLTEVDLTTKVGTSEELTTETSSKIELSTDEKFTDLTKDGLTIIELTRSTTSEFKTNTSETAQSTGSTIIPNSITDLSITELTTLDTTDTPTTEFSTTSTPQLPNTDVTAEITEHIIITSIEVTDSKNKQAAIAPIPAVITNISSATFATEVTEESSNLDIKTQNRKMSLPIFTTKEDTDSVNYFSKMGPFTTSTESTVAPPDKVTHVSPVSIIVTELSSQSSHETSVKPIEYSTTITDAELTVNTFKTESKSLSDSTIEKTKQTLPPISTQSQVTDKINSQRSMLSTDLSIFKVDQTTESYLISSELTTENSGTFTDNSNVSFQTDVTVPTHRTLAPITPPILSTLTRIPKFTIMSTNSIHLFNGTIVPEETNLLTTPLSTNTIDITASSSELNIMTLEPDNITPTESSTINKTTNFNTEFTEINSRYTSKIEIITTTHTSAEITPSNTPTEKESSLDLTLGSTTVIVPDQATPSTIATKKLVTNSVVDQTTVTTDMSAETSETKTIISSTEAITKIEPSKETAAISIRSTTASEIGSTDNTSSPALSSTMLITESPGEIASFTEIDITTAPNKETTVLSTSDTSINTTELNKTTTSIHETLSTSYIESSTSMSRSNTESSEPLYTFPSTEFKSIETELFPSSATATFTVLTEPSVSTKQEPETESNFQEQTTEAIEVTSELTPKDFKTVSTTKINSVTNETSKPQFTILISTPPGSMSITDLIPIDTNKEITSTEILANITEAITIGTTKTAHTVETVTEKSNSGENATTLTEPKSSKITLRTTETETTIPTTKTITDIAFSSTPEYSTAFVTDSPQSEIPTAEVSEITKKELTEITLSSYVPSTRTSFTEYSVLSTKFTHSTASVSKDLFTVTDSPTSTINGSSSKSSTIATSGSSPTKRTLPPIPSTDSPCNVLWNKLHKSSKVPETTAPKRSTTRPTQVPSRLITGVKRWPQITTKTPIFNTRSSQFSTRWNHFTSTNPFGHEKSHPLPMCRRLDDFQYPDLGDCNYYYKCFYGRMARMKCIFGYEFNPHILKCMPRSEANCRINRTLEQEKAYLDYFYIYNNLMRKTKSENVSENFER